MAKTDTAGGATAQQGEAVTRPLSELEQMDWASFQDAYGAAIGTPDLLRRLETGDDHAKFDVCSFLWHQGTVYSATAPAIPFILGLVERGRGDLLFLLLLMARGHGYQFIHGRGPQRSSPQTQAIMRAEQCWVDAARRAVARGAELYRPYLQAADPEISRQAAQLLALCPGDPSSAGAG